MKIMPRPSVKLQEAFALLEANGFEDVEVDETTLVSIEPGTENKLENVMAFVGTTDSAFGDLYGAHENGNRWTWVA